MKREMEDCRFEVAHEYLIYREAPSPYPLHGITEGPRNAYGASKATGYPLLPQGCFAAMLVMD